MTANAWAFYNNFHLWLADSTFNLASGSFNMALIASAGNFATVTNSLYGDLTSELSTANGYTVGGIALSGVAWTITGGTAKFTCTAPVWSASGGSIVCRAAVIYLNATSNGHVKPLVAYALLDNTPADITTASGNTLTITPNASGIFTLSG